MSNLNDLPFAYRATKDGKVFITCQGQQVLVLKGKKAELFLKRVAGLDEAKLQKALTKITGNFKRGNER